MPMISDGSGDMAAQLIQLIAMNRQRAMQQGANLVNTADTGATVGQVGMSPKQFAAMFGKDTPFDVNRVLKPQTSADVIDRSTRDWLKSLPPEQMANVVATNMNNRAGVAGQTSMAGLESQREANTKKAKAEAITAGTQVVTAENVGQMIQEGFDSFKKAKPETRAAMGQLSALGTTENTVEQQRLQGQLGAATLREALDAQTNPNAPIHEFLGRIGLNLPTVMAGTALGIQNLFDTYSHILVAGKGAGFNIQEAMEKAEIEHATDLAKNVFKGTLTPRQVREMMRNQEEGKKPPKGMEGATELYGRSLSAYYNSAIAEQLTKNDPFLMATAQQIQALQKPGVDPNTLVAVRDLSVRAAAYAATLQQVGPQPDDPTAAAAWQQVFNSNVARVPKGGIHFPLFSIGSSQKPGGIGAPGTAPQIGPGGVPVGAAPADASRPVTPVPGVAPVAGVPPVPGGLLTPVNPPQPAAAANALSDEDKKAIADYVKAIGATP